MAATTESLIVEDPEVQAGAPTFRGTRVLVHPVADAIRRGIGRDEIKADYRLTDVQIDAALAFHAGHPAADR
jgi:uncharacterized protein (DUF433 family)